MEGPQFSQGALGSPRESHSLVLLDPGVVNGMRLRSVFVQGHQGRPRLFVHWQVAAWLWHRQDDFFEVRRIVVERAGQREAPPVTCLGCSAWLCSKA